MFRCTKNSTLNRKISTCYFYFVRLAAFFRAYFATNRFFCIKRPGGSAVFWSPRACVIIWKVMGRPPRSAPPGRSLATACRGGPWPSRKPCPAARPPGRCKHRPLQRSPRGEVVASGLAAGSALIRRGGIHPTRKTLRQCGFAVGRGVLPGTVGRAFTPAAPRRLKTVAFAPPQARRDEGIPPYVRPDGRGRPAWSGVCHGV